MPLSKSFINTFFMSLAIFAVASCVPKATEKKAVCGANEAFSSVTRSCYSVSVIKDFSSQSLTHKAVMRLFKFKLQKVKVNECMDYPPRT